MNSPGHARRAWLIVSRSMMNRALNRVIRRHVFACDIGIATGRTASRTQVEPSSFGAFHAEHAKLERRSARDLK